MKKLRIYVSIFVEETDSLWHLHFTETLKEMGHDVVTTEGVPLRNSWYIMEASLWTDSQRERLTGQLIDDFKRQHAVKPFDLFFCYLYPFQITTDIFKEIKNMGVPTVYYFCDNYFFPEIASKYGPHVTLNWVPEKGCMAQFKRHGAPAINLFMAANPRIVKRQNLPESVDASFVGSKDTYRRHILGQLLDKNVPLTIFGNGWHPENKTSHQAESKTKPDLPTVTPLVKMQRFIRWKKSSLTRLLKHGTAPKMREREYLALGAEYESRLPEVSSKETITVKDISRIYATSKVSIGINNLFNALEKEPIIIYSKMREFEGTMSGACMLTQDAEEQKIAFEVDKEIMTWATVDELADKTNYLLKNDMARQNMREAAYRRAMAEHTWKHRFEKLFEALDLN